MVTNCAIEMTAKSSNTTGRPPTPGVIADGETYRLDEFRRRSGMGEWAMRQARRQGLRVLKVGNLAFVRGSDFWAFAERINDGNAALAAGTQSQEKD